MPVTVVVEALEPPELFDFFASFRRRLGINIITLGPSAGGEVLRAIKDRHVVCLLADRDIAGDGIPVDFFGEQTTMPAGPATLALRTGAPLLPTAVYFEGRGGHRAIVGPPVSTERQGRFRDDVGRITQELADRLEASDPHRARAMAPATAELAERLRRPRSHRQAVRTRHERPPPASIG